MTIKNYDDNEYYDQGEDDYICKTILIDNSLFKCIEELPMWKYLTRKFPPDWRSTPEIFDSLIRFVGFPIKPKVE
jgi:hypothetical protein